MGNKELSSFHSGDGEDWYNTHPFTTISFTAFQSNPLEEEKTVYQWKDETCKYVTGSSSVL